MSEPIQSISQGNYILQGTVATSAGIVGDGSTQNPLRADETVLWEGFKTDIPNTGLTTYTLSELATNFETVRIEYVLQDNSTTSGNLGNKGAGTLFYEIGSSFSRYITYIHCVMNGNNSTDQFTLYDIDTNIYDMDKLNWGVKSVLRSQTTNGVWFHITKIVGINRISANNA